MPFQKGNRLAKGGKREGAGRPKKGVVEVKKAAAEIAREYIEAHVRPIIETYVALAAGKVVERRTPEGKKEFVLEVNPRVTIDAVDKLLPAQTIGAGALAAAAVNVTLNVDPFSRPEE